MKRRDLLKAISVVTAGSLFSGFPSIATSQIFPAPKKRVLRIAHITDVHLEPEKDAPKWFAKCLHHLQSIADKPDVIFNGGDTIFDALKQEKDRVQLQWDLWHGLIKNECNIKIEHCIGNHDVWGMQSGKSDPLYGKQYALEMLKLEQRYRSFNLSGWHIIVLDSTHVNADGTWYFAKLDPEQMAWLQNDLTQVNASTPVLVLSHIPILSGSVFYDGENLKDNNWVIPGSWMHTDSIELVALFNKHKNVKVCLSGHIHLLDKVEYNDVTYYCNGAVSGAWWDGDYHETKAGYALVNLYDDGSSERTYIPYQIS